MQDLWRIYGGFMQDLWRIYAGFLRIYKGFMEDLWKIYGHSYQSVLKWNAFFDFI